ncbi:uncharacterized protein CEXT_641391 [Caerostris extrusa]|uniref:Uncharacterized protein n=1 Tax=Caerostris extrusa TaxID=172846 RepID=A0AAV4QQR7_CAEEX|nr:uncharacterized protein CEXT_641391 [Caerostris extrusa]
MPAQMAPVRHQTYMAYRRPALGLVPAAAGHPTYLVRPRYPMVAIRQRMPQMPAPYAAASMYAMPYRRAPVPSPAYMNPMLMRRPYPAPYGNASYASHASYVVDVFTKSSTV